MTCEVAVLNKYALVIAADSAVTSSNGNGAERYSKGGNKIFQLSRLEPVGVMIYGSAVLNGVPWEIIVKSFRDGLGSGNFKSLDEYSQAFFNFIRSAQDFFPQTDLQDKFLGAAQNVALDVLKNARNNNSLIYDTSASIPDRAAAWTAFVTDVVGKLNTMALNPAISLASYTQGKAEILHSFQSDPALVKYLDDQGLTSVVDLKNWADVSSEFLFKSFENMSNQSGIVFAGFGKEQHFPELIEYQVYGFVRYDFLLSRNNQNSCQINHKTPSEIFQFAMTASIDAFTTGVGVDTFSSVRDAYGTHVKKLVEDVLTTNNIVPLPVGIDGLVEQSAEAFSKEWVQKIYAAHYFPMKSIIATLPVQEMVHLAETLIVLQSLKERMTTHSESIGGPVDIAVITKSEGLVWIKRKHYFDSDRNLPYVLRQKVLYE